MTWVNEFVRACVRVSERWHWFDNTVIHPPWLPREPRNNIIVQGGVGCNRRHGDIPNLVNRCMCGVCDGPDAACVYESKVKWRTARSPLLGPWVIFLGHGVLVVNFYTHESNLKLNLKAYAVMYVCVWLTVCPSIAIRWRSGPTPISWSHGTSRWTNPRSSPDGTLLREIKGDKERRWRLQVTASDDMKSISGSSREGGRSNRKGDKREVFHDWKQKKLADSATLTFLAASSEAMIKRHLTKNSCKH